MNKKRLTIRGLNKVEGWEFYGRFECSKVVEMRNSYRYQFKDSVVMGRYLWVELNRNGMWDDVGGRWMYRLNYPNFSSEHYISAGWWSDLENVKRTFVSILETNL